MSAPFLMKLCSVKRAYLKKRGSSFTTRYSLEHVPLVILSVQRSRGTGQPFVPIAGSAAAGMFQLAGPKHPQAASHSLSRSCLG